MFVHTQNILVSQQEETHEHMVQQKSMYKQNKDKYNYRQI